MGEAVPVQEAALNNAEWCHAFCRSHGITGRFDAVAWSSAERTPPLYPDAVTLVSGCSPESVVSRVDASPGCSIKDSFADVALRPSGYEVLFAAEWLRRDHPRGSDPSKGWSAIADVDELERWQAAWGEAPGEGQFFLRGVLRRPPA